MKQPDPLEQIAYDLVSRVLNVDVEHYDTGCHDRQGVVDGIIRYPDGHRAALEVTSVADEAHRELENILDRDGFRWEIGGVRWHWVLALDAVDRLSQIRTMLPEVLRWCEEHNITDPKRRMFFGDSPRDRAVEEWFETHRVGLFGTPGSSGGVVHVVVPGSGGRVSPEDLAEIPRWLTAEVNTPHTARRVAKLRRSGHEERHLFLAVHPSGLDYPPYHAIAVADGAPADDPGIDGVSHVWLVAFWPRGLLLWDGLQRRWSRHSLSG